MLTAGTLRACWLLGLAFIRPGAGGLVLVIAVQFGLVTCMGVFNPVFAAYRLEHTETRRVARTLSAWSVTSNATIAALTALWGLLARVTGPRTAIAVAGLLILGTPLLLPGARTRQDSRNMSRPCGPARPFPRRPWPVPAGRRSGPAPAAAPRVARTPARSPPTGSVGRRASTAGSCTAHRPGSRGRRSSRSRRSAAAGFRWPGAAHGWRPARRRRATPASRCRWRR